MTSWREKLTKAEDFFGKGRFVILGLLVAVTSIGIYAYDANQQAEQMRKLFCGVAQGYNVAVRETPPAQQPPPTKTTLAFRESFADMERGLDCTPDPYDGR